MFTKNVSLKKYSHYNIGGKARYFYHATNIGDLIKAVSRFKEDSNILHDEKKLLIIGGGTNILFPDSGFPGLVVKVNLHYIKQKGNTLIVGSGVSVQHLLKYAAKKGLTGLEWAGGLPGTFGGAVRGNAGAFKGEIKDVVTHVTSLVISRNPPKLVKRDKLACDFSYRDSVFKRTPDEIILESTIKLKKGKTKLIQQSADEKVRYRKERHPMEYPNIGSIFKNVDLHAIPAARHKKFAHVIKSDPFLVVPAAYLIAESGVKGVSYGGAMISPKHPNFIVNVLDATSNDVETLIALVKSSVLTKFNIKLEEEVQIV